MLKKIYKKHTLQQCNNLKERVATAQKENRALKRQIDNLNLNNETINDQDIIIKDLRAEIVSLQDQVTLLTQNLFEGDQIEKARMKKVLTENAYQIQSLEEEIKQKDKRNEILSTEFRQKQAIYDEQKEFMLHLTKEKKAIEKELEDRMKQLTHALDRLALFSADSGVDMNDLEEALDLVKKREDPTYVELGNKNVSVDQLDTYQLKKRINDLELQNKEMIRELALAQDLVNNAKDHHRMHKRQFHSTNEELTRALKDAQDRIQDLEEENSRIRSGMGHPYLETLDESLFENSDSDFGEFNDMDNIVAFRVLKAELNKNFQIFQSNKNQPITFLGVDFYAFKTNFSSLFGGYNPDYKFTAQVSYFFFFFFAFFFFLSVGNKTKVR